MSPRARASLPLTELRIAVLFAVLAAAAALAADPTAGVVAISSKVSPDYQREKLADGTFATEAIAFGKGGVWGGAIKDPTLDGLDFMDVARVVAVPLAKQRYVSSRDPRTTKLLIMVYWGATQAPEHAMESAASQNLQIATATALASNHVQEAQFKPSDSCAPFQDSTSDTSSYAIRTPAQIDQDNAMTGALAAVAAESRARDELDAQNASMLGYDAELGEAAAYRGTPLEFRRDQLVNELEEGRYFVVLMAYDFQLMWKEHKTKLEWETRYSIRQRGNDFGRQLEEMTRLASAYFGRASGGLVRSDMPEGRVEIGQQKILALDQSK